MFIISEKVSSLIKTIVFYSKKSKKTTTPVPFNNPQLTPLGIITKQPKSYDYNLPEDLPNRNLYWDRTVQNKLARERYNKQRLRKLMLNPIHENGKRTMSREPHEILAQLTSINVIKNSINRTLTNIYEAIVKFPNLFLENGSQADALLYAIKEIHQRYLPTLNFYKFSTYCQLRFMAKLPPTQALMLHFFRHLQAEKVNQTKKISLQRLGQLTNYIFSQQYPQCKDLMHKKPPNFQFFEEGQYKYITFEDIVPNLYGEEYLKEIKTHLGEKEIQKSLKSISKLPGGAKLVQKINAA